MGAGTLISQTLCVENREQRSVKYMVLFPCGVRKENHPSLQAQQRGIALTLMVLDGGKGSLAEPALGGP